MYIFNTLTTLLYIRFPGKDFIACLTAFAGLHGITQSLVCRLAVSSLESVCPPLHSRGKHSRHVKVPESIRKQIDEHTRSFPVMKSHYSRAKQNKRRKYLSPLLNVAEMHDLYLKKYKPDAAKPIVTTSKYTSMKT